MKVTLSVIKADIGGWVGHSDSYPKVLEKAEEAMFHARKNNVIID